MCSIYNSTGSASHECAIRTFHCFSLTILINYYHPTIFSANITFVFFIVMHLVSLRSELSKCINHDTTHNVTEKQTKEDKVN